jgi:hypothetical protein
VEQGLWVSVRTKSDWLPTQTRTFYLYSYFAQAANPATLVRTRHRPLPLAGRAAAAVQVSGAHRGRLPVPPAAAADALHPLCHLEPGGHLPGGARPQLRPERQHAGGGQVSGGRGGSRCVHASSLGIKMGGRCKSTPLAGAQAFPAAWCSLSLSGVMDRPCPPPRPLLSPARMTNRSKKIIPRGFYHRFGVQVAP